MNVASLQRHHPHTFLVMCYHPLPDGSQGVETFSLKRAEDGWWQNEEKIEAEVDNDIWLKKIFSIKTRYVNTLESLL